MKKHQFFRGGVMAFLAAALLASCSKDADLAAAGPKPLEEDQSFYVNINIMGADAMTRADGEPNFDSGTVDENTVNSIYLVFYDEEGNRVSTTQVLKNNATTGGTYPNGDGKESRNSFYKGIVQIDVKHGSLPPAYVMAFVNPITSQNFEINPDFKSLNAVSKTTRPMIMGDNGNFAMSKSVYYGKNRVTDETNVKIVATPLVDKETAAKGNYAQQLFKSKQEAEEAMDPTKDNDQLSDYNPDKSSVVNIYVERYAAKVNFSFNTTAENNRFNDDNSIDITLNGDKTNMEKVTLTFKPEYWAVNAYESNTYIVKSFLKEGSLNDGDEDDDSTLTWQELNKALGATEETKDVMPWVWNSETHHRCYWAQTPAYYANRYPRTADDIHDDETENGERTFPLGYYSYNEMAKNAAEGKLNSKARRLFTDDLHPKEDYRMIYARENTVSGAALRAAYDNEFASPKAAIASIVLVGHYEVKESGTDNRFNKDDFIYIRGNATNGYFVYNKDEMLKYFVSTVFRFATDGSGNNPIFGYDTNGDFTDNEYKYYFTIVHPAKDVRKDLVIDSRFVTLQLKKELFTNDSNTELFAVLNGRYTAVTQDNIDYVNEQLLYAAGTVQGYNGGKVYYSIPIQHLGYYRDGNPNKDKTANNKNFDWTAVRSGDFGLVRNHVYTIIVDDIKGLGNGIPDPEDPIVPPTDPEEYYIGARLIILNWAAVTPQHEEL